MIRGFRDLVTEQTPGEPVYDYVRVLTIAGFVAIVGLVTYKTVVLPASFDVAAFGTSLMQYFLGAAALIFGKGKAGAL